MVLTGDVQAVGPGCWAWMRAPGGWGHTNIGLVTGRDGALLIDPWDHRLCAAMLDAFAPTLDDRPVSLLVNTHADGDHWWGNAVVSGAEVLASETTAAAMREEPDPGQMVAMRRLARLIGGCPAVPDGSAATWARCSNRLPGRDVTRLRSPLERDWREVMWSCERWLEQRAPQTAAAILRDAADALADDARPNRYGEGGVVEEFEGWMMSMLGTEAAAVFPSGTMAQQIALRIHCQRRGLDTVAYHPTCHLELHEHGGHAHLHGLKAELVGQRTAP